MFIIYHTYVKTCPLSMYASVQAESLIDWMASCKGLSESDPKYTSIETVLMKIGT